MESIYNSFIIGDCLDTLRSLPEECCALVYLDPPYNTGRNFGEFEDKFDSMKEYAEGFLLPRLEECRRILKKEGNIVVHAEPRNSPYVRLALDKAFGEKNFKNEIAWKSGGNAKNKKQLGRFHDTIIVYSKSKQSIYNPIYKPYDEEYKKKSSAKHCTKTNLWYVTTAIHNSQPDVNPRMNLRYEWNGHQKQWYVSKGKMEFLHSDDRLVYNKRGIPRIKRFLDEMDGIPIRDLWTDINQIQGNEKLEYPTQKPVKLLERIVYLYSNPDDLVVDPFGGSGTTARASLHLGRKYLMIDMNKKAKEVFLESLEEN
tara:strand:+ start:227 stop:1165 length:939 start_codon:yes stop_codon:yes gene_type:complete